MGEMDNENASAMRQMWRRLGATAKWSLGLGVVLCIAVAVMLLWWAMRTDYQVLFSNLEPSDAGVVVQALKAQKVAYKLDDEGRTIRVPADRVYETRLSLMSGGVPLTGGVGFEIFDRQSLGATEQSQRVAYQRALQGELSRTIGALEHVHQARVLLVLPESTLFKRDQQKPSAAVSLVLDAGSQLQDDQIVGIQHLVAAAISGMDSNQVVITDQRGVTISMTDAGALNVGSGVVRLKLKTEVETYVTRKITAMLEKVVGPGQAIVSVDAALNFDQVTRSLQSLVPVDANDATKGGVVHRRESRNNNRNASATDDSLTADGKGSGSSSLDIEYEFGKSLEQVATAPGALTRLSVSVIVPGTMSADREAHLLQLVRAAAGADAARGDVVVLEALDRISNPGPMSDMAAGANNGRAAPPSFAAPTASAVTRTATLLPGVNIWTLMGMLAAVLMAATIVFLAIRRRSLSPKAREALLAEIIENLEARTGSETRI